MSRNPYEGVPRLRTIRKGRIWAAAMAAAALATTVAWAAPSGTPKVTAELVSDAGAHMACADEEATLTEVVRFDEPQPDEAYELSATLCLLGDDGGDEGALIEDGEVVEASGLVRPQDGGRELRLPLTFDARDLAGRRVACLATLSKDGSVLARWRDVADEAQIVRFPKLVASFDESVRGREMLASRLMHVRANALFENVEPGKECTVTATLYDADTGMALLDDAGREVRVSRALKPEKDKGEVSLRFELDGASVAGSRIGMSTVLCQGSAICATHEAEQDEGLSVPKITSSVEVMMGDDGLSKGKGTKTVVETVAYEGLTPGVSYALKGALRDGGNGSLLLDAHGKVVGGTEAAAEVVAAEPDGAIKLTYRVDADVLERRSVTTCDIVTRKDDGRIVAEWDGLAANESSRMARASSAVEGAHTGMPCEPSWERAGVLSVVSYRNLEPGREYAIEGALWERPEDEGTGEAIKDAGGGPVSARVSFKPTEPDGTVEVRYDLDATTLAGRRVVAREAVVLGSAKVTEVEQANDVAITKADVIMTDAKTGISETMAQEATSLAIRVDYGNMPTDGDAEMTCTLQDARTGDALRDAGGSEVSARKRMGVGTDGTVELTLTADTRRLEGHGIAAQVTISVGDVVVATGSAVASVPKAKAVLASAADGSHVASQVSELVATVTFDGLEAQSDHVVRAVVVDAESEEPIRDRDGKEVAGEAALVVEQGSGEAEVAIPLDAEGLAGRTLAVAGSVSRGEVVTAQSSRDTDEGSVVRIPKVESSATSVEFGDGELPLEERAGVTVRVECENLTPGLSYVVSCRLVDEGDGGSDPGVRGEAKADASERDVTVDIPLTIDTRALAGRSFAVRAEVTLDGNVLACSDANAEGRLHVPAVTTRLRGGDGGKVINAKAGTTLRDTVSYTCLTPGVEYVIEGEVVDVDTGKAAIAKVSDKTRPTGGAQEPAASASGATPKDPFEDKSGSTAVWVTDDGVCHLDKACASARGTLRRTTLGIAKATGKTACREESVGGREEAPVPEADAGARTETREEERPSKATVRFTPTEAEGSVEVEFPIDASGLGGKRLVALETLRRGDRVVAEHRDPSDEAQMVKVSGLGSEDMGQTGTGILPFALLEIAAALVIAGVAVLWHRKGGDDGESRR
jgi:hypothetical protein